MDAREAELAVGPDVQSLLATLPPYDESTALALGARLRQTHPAEVAAAALTQSRLRAAARPKFGEFADGMAFSPAGLEQATRLEVAALHAARYRDAGVEHVADLTAGIGADAMAVAALGLEVTAVERDHATALIADFNLRHWPAARVVHADAFDVVDAIGAGAIFADPARRSGASRRHDPAAYEPPLERLLELRDRHQALGLKLGPGVPHAALPEDAEAEWVSVRGDVVEAALWCGPLARAAGRAALVTGPLGSHRLESRGTAAATGPVGSYLAEPDGAVVRAGLVAEAAERIGGRLPDPTIAYVTTDQNPAGDPFVTAYRVLEDLPFSAKALRARLRALDVGTVEIKKRGTAVTPEALRRQLRLDGARAATVVLTRVAGEHRSLIVERVSSPEPHTRPTAGR